MVKVIVFDYYGVLYSIKTRSIDEKILSLAKQLSGEYICVILSNISNIDSKSLQPLKVSGGGIFKEVFASDDIGFAKPDPGSFLYVCDKLSVIPEECLLIDDTRINCTTAKALGFNVINYADYKLLKITINSILNKKA